MTNIISTEIQSLQDQSVAMNIKLKNRQVMQNMTDTISTVTWSLQDQSVFMNIKMVFVFSQDCKCELRS